MFVSCVLFSELLAMFPHKNRANSAVTAVPANISGRFCALAQSFTLPDMYSNLVASLYAAVASGELAASSLLGSREVAIVSLGDAQIAVHKFVADWAFCVADCAPKLLAARPSTAVASGAGGMFSPFARSPLSRGAVRALGGEGKTLRQRSRPAWCHSVRISDGTVVLLESINNVDLSTHEGSSSAAASSSVPVPSSSSAEPAVSSSTVTLPLVSILRLWIFLFWFDPVLCGNRFYCRR